MAFKHPSRRDLLARGTTLAAASSIIGMPALRARAASRDPGLNDALEQIDQTMRQAVNSQTVPGVVAIGTTDKGIVYEGAFGPGITADSVFWIASMTNAITATACMQLVEQGLEDGPSGSFE